MQIPRRRPFVPITLLKAMVALLLLTAATLFAQDSDPRRRTAPPDGLRTNVPQTFALVGADVVVRPGEVIEDATLVLRDGKIVAVGADVEVPADAKELDVAGKRIYAGFIDAYAELSAARSAADPALAEGSGAANYWNANVVPQVAADRVLKIDPRQHEALRKAGFVARVYVPSAGILRGTGALVTTAEGANGDSAILVAPVGMAAQLTVDRGRGRSRGYPSSPMGAVALARQAMYDADWYDQAQAAVADDPSLPRPERNDALAALQPVIKGELPVWIDCGDELYALRADKFGEEFGVPVVIIGSGHEYRRLDLVTATERPIVVPVNFPNPPDVTTPERADAATAEDLMHWDLAPSNPARLADGGATLALTTRGLRKIENEFHKNLQKAIKRGLSGDAALAALTTNAAELAGASEQLGTIEAGKNASFVIADGDLFDPEGKAKVFETWADGKRDVIVPDPVVDLRGTWQIEDSTFKIAGRPEKLSGTWHGRPADATTEPATQPTTEPATQPTTKPSAIKLQNLRQSADRVTFTVDAKALGESGVAVVSLTSVNGELRGTILMPDGTRRRVTATKAEEPATQPTTRPDETIEADPAVEQTDDREAAEDVPTEAQTEEGEPGTATIAEESEDPEAEDDVEVETTPTTQPGEEDEALFEPNYPLGAFGRKSAEAPEAQVVLFQNATVWTCGPEGRIEEADVLIADGRIVAVVSVDDDVPAELEGMRVLSSDYTVELPDGSKLEPLIIDATGKHITPGIIDCHTHIATDGGVNEGTQAVTCEVRIGDFVDPDNIHLYRQLAGGVTAANILHGSANPIGGQNQVIKFRWGQGPDDLKFKEAPPGVKFALGENVKQSNWSSPTGRYPQTRMGVAEIIADSFRAALDYQRAKEDYEANGGLPVRTDLELEALVEMLEGERLVHTHSYRQDEILATLRVFEEFGIQMASLQHILEGYKVAREMADHGVGASTFSDWWAFKFEVYDAIPYNGAIMHDAGVVVSFNSDDAELARRLNTEAAKAVKYGGVPEEEALKFVTLNPARQLGIDEYVGSLEPGKHADLVVWSGHPLSSLSVADQTWIDGRKYFDRAEDAQAKEKVREMRAKLIQRVLSSGQRPAADGETPQRPGRTWADVDVYCHDHDHD